MGEDFTFQNVRFAIQGIANYLKKKYLNKPISIIINYDTRFLSERFAREAAKVLSHCRIKVLFSKRDAPSQALSYEIIKRKAQGGINFTASHNPPEYNGLHLLTEKGAPAPDDITSEIEKEIFNLKQEEGYCPYYPKAEEIEEIDLQPGYLAYIQKKIDFDLIRKSGIKIAVDPLYGASREYLDEILEENGCLVKEIHGYIDPCFGGIVPSCTEENLVELKNLVREYKFNLGIATDADGDRFGIIDEGGVFISPNHIIALLLEYLIERKSWRGDVVRSVATTHLIDRIAENYGLKVHETPVGFKYIADYFIKRKNIILGGEESACLTIKGHLPNKDGILVGLLVAEMIAYRKKSLRAQLEDLFSKYGRRFNSHRNFKITPHTKESLEKLIDNPPPNLNGRKVVSIKKIDGIKLILENGDWCLLRFSGTEPIIRCYAESDSEQKVEEIIKLGFKQISK
ncbi:phosphoglucomutase/phosphomannomutase family protein [Candidatus Aminicenantes bacterium AC-335-O07]|jgi:phosphoglucomutase|nr:phosphoglucomutase/phosphomannomutase family protein [Candidatus Aminicenantes bacterium AC-335-O07]